MFAADAQQAPSGAGEVLRQPARRSMPADVRKPPSVLREIVFLGKRARRACLLVIREAPGRCTIGRMQVGLLVKEAFAGDGNRQKKLLAPYSRQAVFAQPGCANKRTRLFVLPARACSHTTITPGRTAVLPDIAPSGPARSCQHFPRHMVLESSPLCNLC